MQDSQLEKHPKVIELNNSAEQYASKTIKKTKPNSRVRLEREMNQCAVKECQHILRMNTYAAQDPVQETILTKLNIYLVLRMVLG